MMGRLFKEGNETDKRAAALACANTQFEKAKLLIGHYPEYKSAIDKKTINWEVVASKQ
jgi:hypothetical protein